MGDRNWDKPPKVELNSEELQEKAERVAEFEEEQNRNSGKSAALRRAIILADRKLDELEEEEEQKRQELAEYYQKVDEVAEELK